MLGGQNGPCYFDRMRFQRCWPEAEDRRIVSLWQFDDEGLVRSLPREILLQPFPEIGSVHPNGVVQSGVVISRAPEDTIPNFLFMDIGGPFVQHTRRKVDE